MIGTNEQDSLSSAQELELIRHLVSDWHWGSAVLSAFALPTNTRHFLEVDLKGLGAEGDIDLLSFSHDDPTHAVAIQFKVAKISAKTFASLKPNKLQEISKLNRQTTLLAELGFWRTYSCVIVLIDSRSQTDNGFLYGGLTPDLISVLEVAMTQQGLHNATGFVQVNLVQPPNQAPLTTGDISSHLRRTSTPQTQPKALTDWLAKLVRNDA